MVFPAFIVSDHPYITYKISHSSSLLSNYPKLNLSSCESLPKLAHINLELLASSLSATPIINFPQTTCETNIDTITSMITDHLQSAVHSAATKPRKTTLEKNMNGGHLKARQGTFTAEVLEAEDSLHHDITLES